MLRVLAIIALVFLLVAGLFSRLLSGLRLPRSRTRERAHERMVRCALCGVFVPENGARFRGEQAFCSEAHMAEADAGKP